MLGAGAQGRSREMIWGGRWEGGSGLGTHVHPWQFHVNIWQNQYSIVKQNKVKIKIKKKESACNAGDLGLIPGLGRSPGEGNDYPLQYSGLENSMDRGAWWAIVHGIAKNWTQLNNFHFHSVFNKDIFLMKVKDVEEVILIEHMNYMSTNCIY